MKSECQLYFAADLQKVKMLLEIARAKTAVLTRWFTAYNGTFGELGSGTIIGDLCNLLEHMTEEDFRNLVEQYTLTGLENMKDNPDLLDALYQLLCTKQW